MGFFIVSTLLQLIFFTSAEQVSVVLDPNFSLSWEIAGDSITFGFNCTFDGWCGIGFYNSMSQTDMIILAREDGNFQAWDMYSTSHKTPPLDSTKGNGCKDDVNLTSSSFNNGKMLGSISRLLNTGDTKCDWIIKPGEAINFCWAYKKKSNLPKFDKHSTYGQGTLLIGLNQTSSYFLPTTTFGSDYEDHGNEMTVMWLCLAPLCIMLMRYFKWSYLAFYAHMVLGYVILGFTCGSVYEIYKKDKLAYSALSDDRRYHSRIGFILCSFVIAQAVTGAMTKMWMLFKDDLSILRVCRRVHSVLGWCQLIPGLINLKYGWDIKGNDTAKNTVFAFYAILVILLAVLELRHRFSHKIKFLQWNFKLKKLNKAKPANEKLLMDQMGSTHTDVLNDIISKNLQWVFYDEYILNVSGFIQNHPGGAYMIRQAIGEDVGKYINGCSSISGSIASYDHSQSAKNMINSLIIDRVAYAQGVLINKTSDPNLDYGNMSWEIARKYNIAEGTFCIELTSKDWAVENPPKGFEWLGKHFGVKEKVRRSEVTRYYSLMVTDLHHWAREARKEGFQIAKKIYKKSRSQDMLKLHIKRYDNGLMSRHLCDLEPGSEFRLKGPIGPGLGFSSAPAGICTGFAAGTGILPFLDLVYMIWNGSVSSDFCLYLYVSFRSKKESFALDLLEATQKKSGKAFNLHINIDEERIGGKLTEEKLKDWVKVSNVSRAWVCGPSGFNRWIESMLTAQGYQRNKLMIL